MADPYRSQTNAGGGSKLSGASPEAFGAAGARALEYAGETMDRILHRRNERRRDEEAAAAGVEFAEISNELDKAAIDGRAVAAPGGAGHTDGITAAAEKRIGEALGRIKDPKIKTAFTERYTHLRGNVVGREYAWEAATRTEKLVTDVDTTGTQLANGVANSADHGTLELSLDTVGTMVDQMALPEDVKAKVARAQQRKIALAYANAMIDKDPKLLAGDETSKDEATKAGILGLGMLNQYLEPEDIDRLKSGAGVEIRRRDAEDRQQAALEKAAAVERRVTLGQRISNGEIPTDEELDAAEVDATKYGDTSSLEQIKGWRVKRDVAKETRTYTPTQWAATIGELEAIAPDKRTPEQSRRLKVLQELRGPSEQRFNANPHEFANAAGKPAPAIDWANPSAEQGAARVSWLRSYRSATGAKPALLNREELEQFKERAGNGIAGQLEAAQILRNTFGVAGAKLAIEQIDKNNPHLKLMIGLPANTAKEYRLGVEAVQRNPKLNNKAVAAETLGEYGRAIPAEMRGVLYDAARALAAQELESNGNPDPDEDDYAAAFTKGLHRAAGATGTNGGFVRWGETPLWIPPDMPKADALRRLKLASPEDIINANVGPDGSGAGGAPCYMGADGKPVRFIGHAAGQLLKQGTLQTVAPGVFRVVLEDGGMVINKNGQPWQFDIRKLK